MLLAWRDPALELVCSSADAMGRDWPEKAHRVKRLLWSVKHAPNLATLARLRTVRLRVADQAPTDRVPLTVRLHDVEMHAWALTRRGEAIDIVGPGQFLKHARSTTALLIADLTAEGIGSLRKAI